MPLYPARYSCAKCTELKVCTLVSHKVRHNVRLIGFNSFDFPISYISCYHQKKKHALNLLSFFFQKA